MQEHFIYLPKECTDAINVSQETKPIKKQVENETNNHHIFHAYVIRVSKVALQSKFECSFNIHVVV